MQKHVLMLGTMGRGMGHGGMMGPWSIGSRHDDADALRDDGQ